MGMLLRRYHNIPAVSDNKPEKAKTETAEKKARKYVKKRIDRPS